MKDRDNQFLGGNSSYWNTLQFLSPLLIWRYPLTDSFCQQTNSVFKKLEKYLFCWVLTTVDMILCLHGLECHGLTLSVTTLNTKLSVSCHAPGGDGVPGHAGPIRVLGDHCREDLLHVVAVGGGHLLWWWLSLKPLLLISLPGRTPAYCGSPSRAPAPSQHCSGGWRPRRRSPRSSCHTWQQKLSNKICSCLKF